MVAPLLSSLQMMITADMREIAGSEVLAGRLRAGLLRQYLEEPLKGVPEGTTVVLDFAKVTLVTASYFLAEFKSIWDLDILPVIVNATPEVQGEIELALRAANMKALFGTCRDRVLSEIAPYNL